MRVKKIARRLFERMLNRFPTTQKALRARGWGKWRPLIPSDEFINICEDIIGILMALEHEFGDYLEFGVSRGTSIACMHRARIQFLRGSHQQDMEGWPGYWEGFPPMHYATHCVSPCLALLDKDAEHVVCHGSGRIDEHLIPKYGSPFAIETATFKLRDSDVSAEVTRSLFATARQYRESFDAYGSKASFEWQQVENEEPLIHTRSSNGRPLTEAEIPRRVKVPDFAHRLPESIRRFTQPAAIQDADHLSFLQGGGHGGSHPHLVHNFLLACTGQQAPMPDAETSVNWTMVGICAHESALRGGEKIQIPRFPATDIRVASWNRGRR